MRDTAITRSPAAAGGVVAGLLLVATAAAFVVAIANSAWFDLVKTPLGLAEPLPRALLFSSFLLVIGGARRSSRWPARLGLGARSVAVAVGVDAVAFGIAHSANAFSLDPAFVASQVVFACLVGLGCAGLMARTRSVYPAMLLHGVVNAVAVLG